MQNQSIHDRNIASYLVERRNVTLRGNLNQKEVSLFSHFSFLLKKMGRFYKLYFANVNNNKNY